MSEAIRQKLIHEGGGCLLINKSLVRAIGLQAAIIYSELVNKYLYLEKRAYFNTILKVNFSLRWRIWRERQV
ncbi:hypothetical protein FHS14_000310 [Paenibacillus baekrokdamisoli]|nr:hypothetical protein [Paenibacillus baekrokdamisoli]